MSYCRWSSDNWKCDLYCYADCAGGYTIHVAGNKLKDPKEVPELPDILTTPNQRWLTAYRAQMDALDKAEHIDIDLPWAGSTFRVHSLETLLEKIIYLKELGYHVPDYVIEDIKEEMTIG